MGIISSASVLLALLVALYVAGVWVRSYLMPPADAAPLGKELLAAIPLGLVVMSIYARNTFPALEGLSGNATGVYDYGYAFGYAVIMGMISRETLDRWVARPPNLIPRGRRPDD